MPAAIAAEAGPVKPGPCLINPPPARVAEREYDLPAYPHEGMALLAAILRQDGYDCRVIDAKRQRLSLAATIAAATANEAAWFGITAMTHELGVVGRLAAALKSQRPEIPVVLGGVHGTALPEPTLREFPAIDIVVRGEGEAVVTALTRALRERGSPAAVPGLAFRAAGRPITTALPPPADLDRLPFPAYDLLPASTSYLMSFARGCPHACPFCMNPHGRTVRTRSPARVLADVERLRDEFHARELYFGNENILLPAAAARDLLDRMAAAGIGQTVRWSAQTHATTLDPESARRLRAAGCHKIALGVESGNGAILQRLEKGLTRERIRAAVAAARNAGLETELNVVLGLPGETPATARETIDFLVELNPTLPAIGIIVPYPGTEVAALAARGEAGYRIISRSWDDYNKQLGKALELESLPRRELERLQLRGYAGVFLRNRRWGGFLRFGWRYRREALAFLTNHFRSPV